MDQEQVGLALDSGRVMIPTIPVRCCGVVRGDGPGCPSYGDAVAWCVATDLEVHRTLIWTSYFDLKLGPDDLLLIRET